jgi:sugar lactone lactonase YvrE
MPEPQILMSGIVLGESPRWHDDRLWFADWGRNEVIAIDLNGHSEVMARVPSFPISIDWLPDGRMLCVSGRDALLMHPGPDGSLATFTDLSRIAPPPWNELVVDGRANVYVNNTGFDFPGAEFAPGSIVLITPDGSARRAAGDVAFPNGMVVTPDNRTLILAESYASRLTAFEIAPDGSLGDRRVWAELDGGAPDGICLDTDGAVWYADVPNKRCVRVREGGKVLQTVAIDRGCFACMLGGSDNSTLFIVAAQWSDLAGTMGSGAATGQVLTIPAPAPGVGWPGNGPQTAASPS